MKVVDLHPEELLDKDARGELTADERVRLDAHLERCSACRAETVLRADFSAELDGEDRMSEIMGLVQGALAAPRPAPVKTVASAPEAAQASRKPMPELEAVGGLRRRPRRTAVFLLVAAAVLAAGAAGATGVTGRVWQSLRGTQDSTRALATSTATAKTLAPLAAPAALSLPSSGVAVDLAPLPVPEETAAPLAAPPVTLTTALAPAPARVVAPPPPPPTTTAAPSFATASALFDAANTARRTGDTATALARYDALETQFPGTPEARVAKATTGKLLLDRGDAAAALGRFDAYIASGSTELREEAMAGRATALERLGRGDEEARAWSALVASYPGTPYAVHARSRVGRSLAQ